MLSDWHSGWSSILCAAAAALAEAYLRTGQKDLAARYQRQTLQLPPDPPWPDPYIAEAELLQRGLQARLRRAERYLEQDRLQDALWLLTELQQDYPDCVDVLLPLAKALFLAGRAAQAADTAQKIVASAPDHAEAHFVLGNAYYALGRHALAADHYRRTLTVRPDHAVAHFNLARVLLDLGDSDRAAERAEAAVRLRPAWPEAHRFLAELYLQKGDRAAARAHIEALLQLNPEDDQAHHLQRRLQSPAPADSPPVR
ncbi:MAG: hypothetical protein C4297_00115 [Gemmataceae bacterium]